MRSERNGTCAITVVVICCSAFVARAEVTKRGIDATNRCAHATMQATAALVAEDWPAVEALSKKLLEICKNPLVSSFDPRAEAHAHCTIATARSRRGMHALALSEADSGIAIDYAGPKCHLERAWALRGLGRVDEARASSARAQSLARHCVEIETLSLEFEGQPSQSDRLGRATRELALARIYECRSIAEVAEGLLELME